MQYKTDKFLTPQFTQVSLPKHITYTAHTDNGRTLHQTAVFDALARIQCHGIYKTPHFVKRVRTS